MLKSVLAVAICLVGLSCANVLPSIAGDKIGEGTPIKPGGVNEVGAPYQCFYTPMYGDRYYYALNYTDTQMNQYYIGYNFYNGATRGPTYVTFQYSTNAWNAITYLPANGVNFQYTWRGGVNPGVVYSFLTQYPGNFGQLPQLANIVGC
jgi:hypothetical protein